ncbi:MAG: AI-2E family transporter [Acidobacteriota bacterium]
MRLPAVVDASREAPDEVPTRELNVRLQIPVSTILRVLVTFALVWAILKLIPSLILVLVSLILAITLWPAVDRLERFRMPRWAAVATVAVGVVAFLTLFVMLALPPLATQSVEMAANIGAYRKSVQAHLSPQHPILAKLMAEIFDIPTSPEVTHSLRRPLAWGQLVLESALGCILVMAVSLYLLMDGKRTYAWLLAYVPRRHRRKMARTVPAVSEVVMAYVQGQLFTSLLCGAFAFGLLKVLHVPSALPLALLAGICDVLPILGVFIATIPAAFFALTVSPVAAVAVVVLYSLYHALENYVIVPRTYGRRLRLTPLVVLVALLVGGSLYGVLGAILILPFVAAYPIVEKIWLQEYLSDEVVADHTMLEQSPESGQDRAVEAVLQGKEHPAEASAERNKA